MNVCQLPKRNPYLYRNDQRMLTDHEREELSTYLASIRNKMSFVYIELMDTFTCHGLKHFVFLIVDDFERICI